MPRAQCSPSLCLLLLASSASISFAQLATYSNAAAWRTAMGGAAALDIHENFNAYAVPTDVSLNPTPLAGGAIIMNPVATNGHWAGGCMVVVSPQQKALQLLAIIDVQGTGYEQYVDFDFAAPVRGLGFSYGVEAQWSRVVVDVYHDSVLLGSWMLPEGGALFSGFTTTQSATKLRFRGGTWSFRPPQVYFGIDDIEGATTPAPGILTTAFIAVAAAIRRRK